MKKNKKGGMNEQSLQVLACAVAVAVMILLLSGDMLISQFITVNPNQDYSKEKENKDSSKDLDSIENNYDTSFLKEVSLEEIVEKIKEDSLVVVFSGKSTLSSCQRFLTVLTSSLKELNYDTALYLEQGKIDTNTNGYEEFLSISPTLEQEFLNPPLLMFFKNGVLVDYISGMTNENTLQEMIKSKITILK